MNKTKRSNSHCPYSTQGSIVEYRISSRADDNKNCYFFKGFSSRHFDAMLDKLEGIFKIRLFLSDPLIRERFKCEEKLAGAKDGKRRETLASGCDVAQVRHLMETKLRWAVVCKKKKNH